MTHSPRQPLARRHVPFGQSEFDDAKPVVLVVEDHDDSREMLKVLLGILGCRVFEAVDGERAIEMAQTIYPDLILLDMKIPVLDGLTVARMIRHHARLKGVPIIAVSGNVALQFQAEALHAGCNRFLTKPIDFGHLEHLLKTLVTWPKVPPPLLQFPLVVRASKVLRH